MSTEIKSWEIIDGELKSIDKTLSQEGRREKDHLEMWIKTNPEIIGHNIILIGRQIYTKSGPLDFLGIDDEGNTVIVELKRDKLAREVIAQAIDYASDVESFSVDKLSEHCMEFNGQSLEDMMNEKFPELNIEEISINLNQRIILIGFGIDESLSRMIEWLSSKSEISINAVLLNYVKTSTGNELLSRTVILPEIESVRKRKSKKFTISMSDEPGNYSIGELEEKLKTYLSKNLWSVRRLKQAILPALLRSEEKMTRTQLLQELVENADAEDTRQAGYFFSLISNQLGQEKNDFLRQVISYEYPNYEWEKDNFSIRNEYRSLIQSLLKSD